MIRDWIPMGLTLAAFREMELLVPTHYDARDETAWVRWDHILLSQWGFKKALESLGAAVPDFLELCYLLVYGMGAFCIAVLWLKARRNEIDRFYVVLLTGTVLAYALFPYFPSRPPRIIFPGLDEPSAAGWIRRLNLFLLNRATIHTGVFPSAHVSAAFSAAWAMFLVLPQRKRYGWALTGYALCVSIATLYGRYHYAADAVAGFVVSLAAAGVAVYLAGKRKSAHDRHSTGPDTHLVA